MISHFGSYRKIRFHSTTKKCSLHPRKWKKVWDSNVRTVMEKRITTILSIFESDCNRIVNEAGQKEEWLTVVIDILKHKSMFVEMTGLKKEMQIVPNLILHQHATLESCAQYVNTLLENSYTRDFIRKVNRIFDGAQRFLQMFIFLLTYRTMHY